RRAVAEYHVRGEGCPGYVGDARLVAAGRVDPIAGRLGQRELRHRLLRAARGRLGERCVDLEVDVRPAARVAPREDRRERHLSAGVGDLDTAQVVLVHRISGVQRVVAGPVAVPDIDRVPGEWRAGRSADQGERELERNPGGGPGRGA